MGGGRVALLTFLALAATAGCGGGSDVDGFPKPAGGGFGVLSGRTVLVLSVHYVHRTGEGWIGGASSEREAVSQADREIAFALAERRSRAAWVLPERQAATLRRRPSIEVNPHMLSVDQVRREGSDLKRIEDPLYGEIRLLAALFDTRYAVWPFEFYYVEAEGEHDGRVAVRALLLDARTGDVLWQGSIFGDDGPPTSPGALASTAQAFASVVSP